MRAAGRSHATCAIVGIVPQTRPAPAARWFGVANSVQRVPATPRVMRAPLRSSRLAMSGGSVRNRTTTWSKSMSGTWRSNALAASGAVSGREAGASEARRG